MQSIDKTTPEVNTVLHLLVLFCFMPTSFSVYFLLHVSRNFYNEAPVLMLLSLMVERIQELAHIAVDTFQMVVSHSQFLPSILDTKLAPLKGMSFDYRSLSTESTCKLLHI